MKFSLLNSTLISTSLLSLVFYNAPIRSDDNYTIIPCPELKVENCSQIESKLSCKLSSDGSTWAGSTDTMPIKEMELEKSQIIVEFDRMLSIPIPTCVYKIKSHDHEHKTHKTLDIQLQEKPYTLYQWQCYAHEKTKFRCSIPKQK